MRTHLEARAKEYEGAGMSREEAVAKAMVTFGDPKTVAPDLVRANAQYHRRQRALALCGALLVGVSVPEQALLLDSAASNLQFYAELGVRHTAAATTVGFLASWHWLLLAVLLAAQAAAVVSATRRLAYGRQLLITGLVALLVAALLLFLLAAPIGLNIVHNATTELR